MEAAWGVGVGVCGRGAGGRLACAHATSRSSAATDSGW